MIKLNNKQKFVISALAVFAAGIAVGGFCSVRTSPETIYEYFTGLRGGLLGPMAGTAALNAVFVWAVLFFSAFFRFGTLTAMLTVFVKGFTNGFAITAILKIFAVRGLLLALVDIFYVPLVLYFAAVTCARLSGDNLRGFAVKGIIILLLMVAAAVFGSVLSYVVGKYCLPALEV